MKHLLLIFTLFGLGACGADNSDTPENNATELRDWAQGHTSRAEITVQIAEAKMALRLAQQTDPQGAKAKALIGKIEKLENELDELASGAKQ